MDGDIGGFAVTKVDLEALADLRLAEAEALLQQVPPKPDGAYYLAGYAVECALKAVIAKMFNQHDFPEKHLVISAYTHNINDLVEVAGLKGYRKIDSAVNPILGINWSLVQ